MLPMTDRLMDLLDLIAPLPELDLTNAECEAIMAELFPEE